MNPSERQLRADIARLIKHYDERAEGLEHGAQWAADGSLRKRAASLRAVAGDLRVALARDAGADATMAGAL